PGEGSADTGLDGRLVGWVPRFRSRNPGHPRSSAPRDRIRPGGVATVSDPAAFPGIAGPRVARTRGRPGHPPGPPLRNTRVDRFVELRGWAWVARPESATG